MPRVNPDLVGDMDLAYDPFVDDDAELRGGTLFPWMNSAPHSQAHVNNDLKPPSGGGGGSGGGGSGGGGVPATQALAHYAGPSFTTVGNLNGFYMIPPDTASAVSESAVVLAVNGEVQVYQRADGGVLGTPASTTLDGFFGGSGIFDPRVIYDPISHRIIVAAVDQGTNPNSSDMWVAVSSDATGTGWSVQHFSTALTVSGASSWADFPQVGLDNSGDIYLTANMFSFSGGAYQGSRMWITNESGAAPTLVDPSAASGLGLSGPNELFSLAPANMVEPTSTTTASGASASGEYLVAYNSARNSQNHNVLDVMYVTASGTVSHSQWDVGLIDQLGQFAGIKAPQPGTTQMLDADDSRVASAVYKNGYLYVAADIVPNSGPDAGHATAHWWALSTDGAGNVTGLVDQGDISGNTFASGSNLRSYYPSLAVLGSGALAVSFSGSGPTNGTAGGHAYTGYASAYEVTIANPLLAGSHQEQGNWQLVESGVASYYRTFGGTDNRWGDYSSISTDPSDPSHAWAFNEYAMAHGITLQGQNGLWGTELGYF